MELGRSIIMKRLTLYKPDLKIMNLKLILLSLLVLSSNTQHIELIDRLVNISWVNEGEYTFFVAKAKLNSGITPSNA